MQAFSKTSRRQDRVRKKRGAAPPARRHGEGMTAAKSLPGENQSLADLSRRLVARRRMPIAFFSCTLVLVACPAGGVRAGEPAGDAKHASDGGCSGEIDVESVQCVTNCCCCCC